MRVHVSDPRLVEELVEALRRCEYVVALSGPTTLTVREPDPPLGIATIDGAAELELDLYLKVWEATHPGVRAARTPTR